MKTNIEKKFAAFVRKHGEDDGLMHLWYLPRKVAYGTSFKYGNEERTWDALSLRAFKEDCEDADYWKDKIEVFFIDTTDTHEIDMSLTEVANVAPELYQKLTKYMSQTMTEKEIVEAIKGEPTIAKHIKEGTWTSGCTTEVYPITLWERDVDVQLDLFRNVFDKAIKRVLAAFPHLFKNGYYCKHDGSCPDEVRFVYTDETRMRLAGVC